MAWPAGPKHTSADVEKLVRDAIACNLQAKQDMPQNLEEAVRIIGELDKYVNSLPEEKRSIIAKNLVSALGTNRPSYQSSVVHKKSTPKETT